VVSDVDFQLLGRDGDLEGLHYAITIEPTLHVTERFAVALGIGYAGLIAEVPTRHEATLDTPGCSGAGIAAVARLQYLFRLGRRASTGPNVGVLAQWTACETSWRHIGPTASWIFQWR
jgi:hypothetical protein